MSLYPFDLVSTDAQTAQTQFVAEFLQNLEAGAVQQWATDLGRYLQSNALKTVWPFSISAAGYEEFTGDMRFRKLAEKSLELKPKTYQDGVEELASVIEAPDFIGWADEPTRMANEGLRLPNSIIATALEAGTSAVCWDGEYFFDTDHPVNIYDAGEGTFSNLTGSRALSVANLATAKKEMRQKKAANGKPMGLRVTHILVPSDLEETALDITERDFVIENGGTSDVPMPNRHKGTVKVVVADELTDTNDWYAIALNRPSIYPWIVQTMPTPEIILHDKTSSKYKETLKIAIAIVLRGNGALAWPHCIHRYQG